jgi:hypothetical protein
MYKCINNSAPDYLCNLFDMTTNPNVYSLRSVCKGKFVLFQNQNLWNSLPPILKLIQDIDLLKKKYADYLMSKQNNE